MSDTKHFPLFAVEINRGKDVITVDKPEHEIKVLQLIHDAPDAKHVKIVGPSGGTGEDQETIELAVDRNAEFDRLMRTYNRVNAPNPVNFVFPRGAADLDAYGFGDSAGPVAQKPGSMVKKHKPAKAEKPATPKPEPAKEAPKTDPPKDDKADAGKK